MFSNPDFMRGVLTGYWHGDGCLANNHRVVAQCINKSLLSQIMLCMSYFGFQTSLLDGRKPGVMKFPNGVYETKQAFNLVLRRSCQKEFVKFINDKNYEFSHTSNILVNKITSHSTSSYDGYVYNLEVEDDHSYSLINACVHNCFTDDSTGFFKRSMIDRAMPTFHSPIMIPETGTVVERFPALLRGYSDRKYVMSIDTASQRDNFAIVILEMYSDHARIVHVWTTNAADHNSLQEAGFAEKETFSAFCVKKIRGFMKNFNIIHISMDAQGGGRQVYDLLHDEKYLESGDIPLWEMDKRNPLWDGKERPTDGENGLHIVELVEFSNYKYISDANHNLKNDFEQLRLIFPYSDDIEYVLAGRSDYEEDRKVDTLERVMSEVDALKDELAMIQHDTTDSKREKWFVPKTKGSHASSDLHDDRYAALLMANYAARRIRALPDTPITYPAGGFVGSISQNPLDRPLNSPLIRPKDEPLYTGPAWATNPLNKLTGYGLVKRGD
jgi:hypothetical protein